MGFDPRGPVQTAVTSKSLILLFLVDGAGKLKVKHTYYRNIFLKLIIIML